MTSTEPKAVTVTVDGDLAGELVDALEAWVKQEIGCEKPVHPLRWDLSSADENGRALLGTLAGKVCV